MSFDLIILLDDRSYYNRNELMSCLGLQQCPDINGDELYAKDDKENERYIIADITKDLSDYSENDVTLPYNVCGVCHLRFYPFDDIINEILSAIIGFNSELFVDDDNDNILNICDYKNLVAERKVYPYTYCSKDYF